MSKLSLTKAFAQYGARLRNYRWSVSAIARDGSLVFSCWHQLLIGKTGSRLVYKDKLSRWQGNHIGRDLLHEHLTRAFREKLPVRMVIATLKKPQVVTADASTQPKTFSIRKDLVGRVVEFDGDTFVIDYEILVQHMYPSL